MSSGKKTAPLRRRDYTGRKMKTGRLLPGTGWAAALLAMVLLRALLPAVAHAQRPVGPVIEVAHINGPINEAMARYAARVIGQAEQRDAQLLVFTLDTP